MIKDRIESKLLAEFSPSYLSVEDESHLHVGHENYRPGGDSHFYVRIASSLFDGLSRVQRHQLVYACLEEEFKNGLHALRLTTLSPQEGALPEAE